MNLCFLIDIFLSPALSFLFVRIFSLDTLILLHHLHLKTQKYILGLASPEAHYYVLINKVGLARVENPNSFISAFLHHIIFLFLIPSRVFRSQRLSPWPMQVDRA
jgi:hypothetical protein